MRPTALMLIALAITMLTTCSSDDARDPDGSADTGADGDADSDGDDDGDADLDADSETDGDIDADADADVDGDADTDGDVDGEVDGDGDTDMDGDADPDGDGDADIECAYGGEFADQFDRSCSEDDDCVVGFCAVDCCGTWMAVGINRVEEAHFAAAWAECEIELVHCECPSGPTRIEDGSTALGHDSIQARCEGGECRSYLP